MSYLTLLACRTTNFCMTNIDEYWMERALEMAARARHLGEIPVGAVVALGDRLISEAYNEKEQNFDSTAHAEILAIQRAGKELGQWRLKDCTLYVTLEPCLMCVGAVIASRVDRLVYGALDKKAGAVESTFKLAETTHFNHYPKISSGVLAEKSGLIIKEFFQELRLKK
jgi:tRNA(adenine34) deaminase